MTEKRVIIIVQIGLVGLGFIGKTHLNAYRKMKHCKVTAICTKSGTGDKDVLAGFDGDITSDYEELLSDPTIDVIDICLPTFLHEAYIVKAAQAKKHIICEKPLTLTTDSAERIIDAVNQHNVQLYVGHVVRFWPEYTTIKSYHEKGSLHDIEIVHAQRLGQSPNWSSWFQDPEKSGGALYDLHIHDIDFTYDLLGEVDTVYATGMNNEQGAWVHVMTMLTFKNGSKAFIEASHRMPDAYPFSITYRAQTKDNAIEFTIRAGDNIENMDSALNHFHLYAEGKNISLQAEAEDAFYQELTYFIDCISGNKTNTIIPLSDVFYTLRVLEAIERSLQKGEVVKM